MKRRLFLAAGTSALMLATMIPGAAMAREPERFGRVDTGGRTPDASLWRAMRDPDRQIPVLIELTGRPVGAVVGAARESGADLSESEKQSIRSGLAVAQGRVATRLRAAGARIHASFTDVANGFRATVRVGDLGKIAAIPGVSNIRRVPMHFRTNENTVSYMNADRAWERGPFTGEGVSIAIIDSGVNYYHADFGGPGNPEFQNDDGEDRSDGNFPTEKVIAGYDLVGDEYNPSDDDDTNDTPDPDNDPLDCKDPESPNVQHGTHVAGTAAGYGVRANGTTYTGPWDGDTVEDVNFRIGPGTAPEASLMAFRVFGCDGGTWVVVDAVERAVRAGADVINMSLGSDFGHPGTADAVAVDNASLAGVTVVMSAGNDGPSAYAVGSPGVATRGIAVAAMDATETIATVNIDMDSGDDITGINANGDTNDFPVTGEVNVFVDNPATPCDEDTGEGCEQAGTHASAYVFNGYVPGQIPVTFRGFGARVDRAKAGDAAGAPAVIMVNNSEGFPPYEGPITGVDIPFVGVPASAGARFQADEGEEITLTGDSMPNPNYRHTAGFTSGGPRRVDNMLKPDVVAPGVSILSADGATVDGGKILGGTSMASPAVAGIAALVLESQPSYDPRMVKAAIIGTARPNKVSPFDMRLSGNGMPNPLQAATTDAYAFTSPGASTLTFGGPIQVNKEGWSESRQITLVNDSSSAITYRLSNTFRTDTLGATVSLSRTAVTVPANDRRKVTVTVSISGAAARQLPAAAPLHGPNIAFDDFGALYTPVPHVAGQVIATPNAGAGNYKLKVPWIIAPRGVSTVNDQSKAAWTEDGDSYDSSVRVRNYGVHRGIADFFAWGLQDGADGLDGIDLRAVGVQSLPSSICDSGADAEDACLVFAVNTWNHWNNASENEFDILISTDNDDAPEYALIGIDAGVLLGTLNGVYISAVLDLTTFEFGSLYLATAPVNSGTVLLPALASDFGLDSEQANGGRFDYYAEAYDYWDDDGTLQQYDYATTSNTPPVGSPYARFHAFDHPISNGMFEPLAPGAAVTVPLSVSKDGRYDPTRGMKGWMMVTLDDVVGPDINGRLQADLILVGELPD